MGTFMRLPRDLVLGLLLCVGSWFALGMNPSATGVALAVFSVVLVGVQTYSFHMRRTRAGARIATRAILEALPDAVLVIRATGEIAFQKDVMAPGKPLIPALSSDDNTLLAELVAFARAVAAGEPSQTRTLTLADDHVLECRASLFQPDEVLVIARDITEAHIDDARIRYLATHDQLTGLLNRSSFLLALDQAVARAQRSGKAMGLLFLDLNRFKVVNDTLGHAAGDELLKQVATRIQACLRASDAAFRLAGDEFTVIVEHLDGPGDVHLIAEKLRQRLAAPYFDDPAAPQVSASIGAVAYPKDGILAKDLLLCADKAMYQDKALGREKSAR
jgi:diguanylate cyclase (GGDEF)-like protein